MRELVAVAHYERVKGVAGIQLVIHGIEIKLALQGPAFSVLGRSSIRALIHQVLHVVECHLELLHRVLNLQGIVLLNPILEFSVGHAHEERIAGGVGKARGSKPRLKALRVQLWFKVCQDLLPSVHGAFEW